VSDYGIALFPQHQKLLRASAISPDVARQRNYQSVDTKSRLESIDIPKAHRLVPGLLIPVYGPQSSNGEAATWQYRPDNPRIDAKGRPAKYVTAMRGMVVDVPPGVRPHIGDPSRPLFITEGIRKVDSAVSHGIDCLGVLGVWNWRGGNANGGTTALAVWEYIALNGRDVYLCFDSDVMVNPKVRSALLRFAGFLETRKATVRLVMLPDADDGGKVGLDDYLAAGGTVDDLEDAGRIIWPSELGAFTRDGAEPEQTPYVPPAARTLAEAEATFAKWLHDDDPVPTRAVLAAYIANQKLPGDSVWLMLVGGSGIGKTERLVPLAPMPDVVMASTISGEAALLSGTNQRDRARDATGGLLRRKPDVGGVLLLKDFTSILAMHRDARGQVLGALREIHDGRWDRNVGADGGRTLTWTGRLGLVAGCTTAIDSAHAVMAEMGPRFVLVRLTEAPDHGDDLAGTALDHTGAESTMRQELRDAVGGLLAHLPGQPHPVDVDTRARLIALARLVSLARSPVQRDQQGEIVLVLDPEAPTRIVKTLGQLWKASGLLGLELVDSWDVVRRVGLDSVPKLRRAVIDYLADAPPNTTSTTDVAQAVGHPTRTTRRALEDLTAHKVVVRYPGGQGRADSWELSETARGWLTTIRTLPVSSDPRVGEPTNTQTEASTRTEFGDSTNPPSPNDDITGKVPAPVWDYS
jgi:hypothetical protein